jgi:hypothetical protein
MIIGMTGNRTGISEKAMKRFRKLMNKSEDIKEGHHGDCLGADTDFHDELTEKRIKTIIHPPDIDTARAFSKGTETRKPKPYIARNHDIVDECDVLIGFPSSDQEAVRSGTWATIRYARKIDRRIYIIFPNGKVKQEN